MRVVYFGTPQFAAEILKTLLESKHEIVAVVSRPDRPQGRSSKLVPTAVKVVAEAQPQPIPVLQPEKTSSVEFTEELAQFNADLFVVAAYGEIVRDNVLYMPPLGCINVHGSLLPKYRGAAPIQRCLIDGETETGITIIHMVRKMDAGDIISSTRMSISQEMTYGDLEEALWSLGGKVLLESMEAIEAGTATRTVQNEEEITFAKKLEPEEGEIDWQRPAQDLHNLIRGFSPQPSAWCTLDHKGEQKRLKITRSEVVSEGEDSFEAEPPGELLRYDKRGPVVKCGEGAIRLLEVQLQGKKRVSGGDFTRGVPMTTISMV